MKSLTLLFLLLLSFSSFAQITTYDDLRESIDSDVLTPMWNYTPSVINSEQELKNIFYSLPNTNKWTAKPLTQCFNRAHFWAKYMEDKFSVDSMKIFIYFTQKFQREVSDKWWFHVASLINFNGELYVLDNTFFNRPVTIKTWEEYFLRKLYRGNGLEDYRCKNINFMSEYHDSKNQNKEYCNIQITSMYYWEPKDMEQLEVDQIPRDQFEKAELLTAVKNIFWRWGKYFNQLKF
ncbi:MAG: hypothetical protein CME62_05610 [Halobacteriovoraceae bacterium]|nr:hypothetical protein [Halobacteriovoraceae bacterium]|tara:strand:- start:3495 stop:4199 length:705 start_codon:yes stop_codon:yes gene_type:complete